jgi:hypothetical protein
MKTLISIFDVILNSKKMRTLFFIILMLSSYINFNAQCCCDIQQYMSTLPNAVPVGVPTFCVFDVFNDAAGSTCTYPVNSVEAVLSIPSNGLAFQALLTPAHNAFFDWAYDPAENVVRGVNHKAIGDGEGDFDVTVKLVGSVLPYYPQIRIVGLTLGNNPEGPIFPSNAPENDNSASGVEVQAPLPITLFGFNGESKNCDYIHLVWTTSTEVNNDYMGILRSKDGKQFVSIGKVKGTNSIFGDSYSFDDKSELEPGKNYYYRIKQVDLDGKINLHNVIMVRYYCKNMIPEMAVFPNPASELINVSFSGLEKDQKTDLVITNKLGMVVKKLNVNTDDISEIQISDLPSGIYKIQTTDFDDNLDYRFIHIK